MAQLFDAMGDAGGGDGSACRFIKHERCSLNASLDASRVQNTQVARPQLNRNHS